MSTKPSNPSIVETLAADPLDAIAVSPHTDRVERLHLPSGRRVDFGAGAAGEERLTITGKGGRVELSILLTDAGPKLSFESAEIALKSAGAVTVDCAQFEVRAAQSASITAPGVSLEATEGDAGIRANDRVLLNGEEIRMNCDKTETVPEWMQRELGARLTTGGERTVAPRSTLGDTALAAEMEEKRRR